MDSLSRRELLASLLGLSAACQARRPRRTIDGQVFGANDRLGHQLRDGLAPAAQKTREVPIVIAGGGVAGLSAAWRLLRSGVRDFEVLELDEEAGGTSRGGRNAVSPFPWGAHYVPCPLGHARALTELLVEAGVAERGPDGALSFDEDQLCRAPQERLFIGGRWSEGLYPHVGASADDLRQLAQLQAEVRRLADLRDSRGRRAFAVPVAHGSDDEQVLALDRLSAQQWLDARGLTSPRLRWYVEYACRDDFGATLAQTSAWAALHYFASRQEQGRTQELLTWPEGNARLVGHLARAVGHRLRTGVAVTRIDASQRGAVVHTFEPRTGRAEQLRAGQVILAVPRAFAARMLRDERTAREASLFPTSAWLVCNLTLSRAPLSRGFPLAWDNVLYGSKSLGYVVATHQRDSAPGPTVWTWYLPLTDDDPGAGRRRLLALSHAEIAELALADLRRPHPDIDECVSRLDAWKWGHAMVRPSPGLALSAARRAASLPRGALHFAHTELSGLALFEEAQHHGVRAAEEVLAARGVAWSTLLD
jgi:protoporphyrinogen oxidase